MAKPITIRILGDSSNFERALGQTQAGLGKLGKFAAAAGAAVVAGAAAVGVKSVAAFADFQKGMNEVYTLLPNISGEAMKAMEGQVKSFSSEFGVLPEKTIPALYQAISAGVPQANVFDFLETAQKAAKGGVTELSTAVDGISSVVNAYGSDVVGATQASDLMFTAVKLGKTDFEQLSKSLFNVIPTAASLGVEFGDVTAALASMTAQGTPTTVATTQLRQLFVELSKDGSKVAATFEELSGKSFAQFIAEGGNTADALAILSEHAADSDKSIADLFGSVEAGNAALALSGKNADGYRANLDAMAGSAGATDAAFQTMSKGLADTIEKIKARFQVLLVEIGSRLAPLVEKALAAVTKAFGALSDWWAQNGPGIIDKVHAVRDAIVGWVREVGPPIRDWVQNVLGSLSEWWASNGPTVIALATALKDGLVLAFRGIQDAAQWVIDKWNGIRDILAIVGTIILTVLIPHWAALAVAAVASSVTQAAAWVATQASAIAAVVSHSAAVVSMVAGWVLMGVQAMLGAAKVAAAWLISMGPIALVVAAVVGLVALIIANFDTIKATIAAAWEWVKSTTSTVWNAIKGALSAAWEAIKAAAAASFEAVKAAISAAWDAVKASTDAVWAAIKGAVSAAIDAVKGAISAGMEAVKGAWSSAWNAVKSTFDTVAGGIRGAADALVGFLTGLPGRVSGSLSSLFRPLATGFDSVIGTIKRAWNSFAGFWNGVSVSIPKIDIPGVGSLGGGSFSLPNLPRFAKGAVLTEPTVGLMAEYAGARQNPEIVTPEKKMREVFRDVLAEGGGGPVVIEQHFHGFSTDEAKRLAREGTREALREVRQQVRSL